MGELFNLASCLLIRQYGWSGDEKGGESIHKLTVVRRRSTSCSHRKIKSLLTRLKARAQSPIWKNLNFIFYFSELVEGPLIENDENIKL